jgi:hypothetical protein
LPPGERKLSRIELGVWLLGIHQARRTAPETDVVPGPETRAVQRAFDEQSLRDALHAACHPFQRRREPAAQA